jgi:hypothetical protein
MAVASINWNFGQRAGAAPIVSCTFSVLVTRDGLNIGSFSVTTNASGAASGVYQDATASDTATHQYVFTPQMAGCAVGCSTAPVTTNWNCAGTAPPPPPPAPPGPPPPPSSPGCPVLQDTFQTCGTTAPSQTVAIGAALTLTQNFGDATTTTVTAVPGMTATTSPTSASLTGAPTTAGTYNVTFTGTKAGCAPCTVVYPIIVASTSCATQSVRVLQGPSAYVPPSSTSFNAADQLLEVSLTGIPGQTFQLVATGTVSTSSGVLTIPPSGNFTFTTAVGQAAAYSTAWGFFGAGSNPITLCTPGTVTITGSTCLTMTVTQTLTDYTIVVTAPAGANNVPFALSFGGAPFGGSFRCTDNSFGTYNGSLTTGASSNVFTFGPVAVTSPYTAAIKLDTVPASASTHAVCGAACQQVSL